MLKLTYLRRRTLAAIRDEPTRFYYEAKEVWDAKTGRKHTAEFRKLAAASFIRAATAEEHPVGGLSTRTYYRLDVDGERAMRSNG